MDVGASSLCSYILPSILQHELSEHHTRLLGPLFSTTMDKTKSKLAAFFDNDDDESSFPVRTENSSSAFIPTHRLLIMIAKGGR